VVRYFRHIERLRRDHDYHDHVRIHQQDEVQDDEVLRQRQRLVFQINIYISKYNKNEFSPT